MKQIVEELDKPKFNREAYEKLIDKIRTDFRYGDILNDKNKAK